MRVLTPGMRLKSSACTTQVMIIKTIPGEHDLSCGGAPMLAGAETGENPLNPELAEGTLTGKRYVNADESLELLCVKEGAGTLTLDGVKLQNKQAKALPTSD